SMSSTPLLPTLYAILPSSSHTQTLARLSLLAIHVESLDLQDDIYLAIQPVLPGRRTLRIRTKRIIKHLPKKNPSERLDIGEMDERKEQYEIVYLSSPLSGREYSSVNVRACQSLDVVGFVDKDEVVGFVEGLGFSHSHSFKQKGTLFHIPIPGIPMTFHLSVTQLIPLSSSSIHNNQDLNDYLIQLYPSRPVHTVSSNQEPDLQSMMNLLSDLTGKLDWLEWGSGR
ncbi:hypothetical protein TREMEDRAFT_35559, partial [Tremella mesenterica DSM 1558]|uniref:uncharacterized protein n=1 Tax=Tremella mesenterica (strain ATCC 24925 / CBS 8224 / DSM 1558 / NBRC 9311 / NRRL Y-6157 / RJB 2259-6 / UBC 559-6) TaxID=578456 RepID=UPI00032D4B3D